MRNLGLLGFKLLGGGGGGVVIYTPIMENQNETDTARGLKRRFRVQASPEVTWPIGIVIVVQ